jgi:hypothetical protein
MFANLFQTTKKNAMARSMALLKHLLTTKRLDLAVSARNPPPNLTTC